DRAGLAATDFEDQARDALNVLDRRRVIDATLEAMRRVRREVVLARTAPNAVGPPKCRLEIHVRRIERYRRAVAPHDAGKTFDLMIVRDDSDRLVKLDRVAVEQLERLAAARPTHLDTAMDLVEIEHVRRTPKLEHDVVRDVDERRNASLSRTFKPL